MAPSAPNGASAPLATFSIAGSSAFFDTRLNDLGAAMSSFGARPCFTPRLVCVAYRPFGVVQVADPGRTIPVS